MKREKLEQIEIEERLAGLDRWMIADGKLMRRFKFRNFGASLAFVNAVGEIAEAADHHPDITFGWGYAEIVTTTHDRGGITDFDFDLARKICELEAGLEWVE